ncbi:hypothetical protein GCM10009792_25880 [Microcella alkalica]|uniref:Pr6Pr family membrane protein n=1 Tax=Microcella alkalica TaxID=355930 RepID=A0A839EEN3_9MICO|nr:hypothetical protein [Microcella alkalica]
MTAAFLVLRAIAVLAIGAAVVGQIITSLGFWADAGLTDTAFRLTNFFSIVTIESNVASVVVLTMAIGLTLMGRRPTWFEVLRAAVTTYMVTGGIVYNMLLRGIELPQWATLAWSNEILHVWGPLYLLIDRLFAPGRIQLEWKQFLWIIGFPLVWAVYTLIRGPLTYDPVLEGPFYPYPFLNPVTSTSGYVSVAFYVILIAAVIGLVGAAIIRISRTRLGQATDARPVSATA